MANQAAKRKDKQNSSFERYFAGAFWLSVLVYAFYAVLLPLVRSTRPLTTRNWVVFLAEMALSFYCYRSVVGRLEHQLWSDAVDSYAFDVLVFSVVIRFLSFLSVGFYWLYLVIPIYAVYKLVGLYVQFARMEADQKGAAAPNAGNRPGFRQQKARKTR